MEIHGLIPEGPHLDESDMHDSLNDHQTELFWQLWGLMRKHFPSLRDDQLIEYSIDEMEEILEKEGYL